MIELDEDVRKLLQLPEDTSGWTAEDLARFLSGRLQEVLSHLGGSAAREKALLEGLKVIAFEMEFCQACGQMEGNRCESPGRCRFAVPPGRQVALQVLEVHKAALRGGADGVEEPADKVVVVPH